MNIPKKPTDAIFTDAQWQAIWQSGRDVLVSAAAGSGKTHVLITRLIEKVLHEEHPIDVDQLLVVTFTNAAAAEMRQRMSKSLSEALMNDPTNRRLQRQLTLLNKAHISTMHSFCLHVVKQHAYELNIDPAFRIADTMEAALLREDVLQQLLETLYGEEETEALTFALVDSFSSDRSDENIEHLIERLYDYASVSPTPYEWLRSIPSLYDVAPDATLEQLPIVDILFHSIKQSLTEVIAQYEALRTIVQSPDGPASYIETIEADLALVMPLVDAVEAKDWNTLYERLRTLKFPRATTISKGMCDKQVADTVKTLRTNNKKVIETIRDTYFTRSPERLVEEIRMMHPILQHLAHITERFYDAYQEAKRERALVDFSDLEHYALEILCERDEDGSLRPSAIAQAYRDQFAEVLVDEYQDTNLLQEAIIQLVKTGEEENGNLFMVGDVKQSIYSFRHAEPQLFLTKYDRFSSTHSTQTGMNIDLNANFRSRPEVLAATNFIFSQLMSKDIGGIQYDDRAALHYGAQYVEKSMPTRLTLLYEGEEEVDVPAEEMKTSRLEARAVIADIQRLFREGYEVTDAFSNEKRPIEYRDIVILFRSTTWSDDFADEFKRANIPLHVELKGGYFEAIEVKIMMSVLQIIDNSYQDIPLAATLRAPFFHFTDEELSIIRLGHTSGTLYEALVHMHERKSAPTVALQQKINAFFTLLTKWKNIAQHGSVAELVTSVLQDTHYETYVSALPNGKQRQANVRALQRRALAYEQTSYRGLFRFLRFIERMRSRGEDLSEARHVTDQDNVVRLMTIHKSKGLEFPYVYIPGLARPFNDMDYKKSFVLDAHYGLGVKAIDPVRRATYSSIPFQALVEKNKLESRTEEMRILYVAMTRAKEYVHLIGTTKRIEDTMQQWERIASLAQGVTLPTFVRATSSNYLDWIGPALVRHPQFEPFLQVTMPTPLINDSQWEFTMVPTTTFAKKEEQLVDDLERTSYDESLKEEIRHRLDWQYAYKDATVLPSKYSVTGLKRATSHTVEEEWYMPVQVDPTVTNERGARPAFLQSTSTLTGAERGTAIHAVMEWIDFRQTYTEASLQQLLDSLVSRQLLTEEERSAVDISQLLLVLPILSERIGPAKTVWREVPFTSTVEVEGESVLLQGIIDCIYEDEEGQLYIVDYKTDRIPREATVEEGVRLLKERYTFQLSTYRDRLQQIVGPIRPVREALIFSFALRQFITI